MIDSEMGTQHFKTISENPQDAQTILLCVYHALSAKGYDPITQIVGYLISGDPTYITGYQNARSLICRIDRDELLEELREQGYSNLQDIKYAILENSGQLSVFPWTAQQPPTTQQMGLNIQDDVTLPMVLINDGRVNTKNLTACGRDIHWLQKQLTQKKISSPQEVFLLTLDEQGSVFCVKKEAAS